MKEWGEQISDNLQKSRMQCTCVEEGRFEREEYVPCAYCSLGQQSADLIDIGVGVEGVDY